MSGIYSKKRWEMTCISQRFSVLINPIAIAAAFFDVVECAVGATEYAVEIMAVIATACGGDGDADAGGYIAWRTGDD